jgi:THO complex subunit 1
MEKMDVDQETGLGTAAARTSTGEATTIESQSASATVGPSASIAEPADQATNTAAETQKESTKEDDFDLDKLYPVFWSLQQYFSNPPLLFNASNLQTFKTGLAKTIETFIKVQKAQQDRPVPRRLDETRRGMKRKAGGGDEKLASGFSPKYLTSRELFELEVRM